MIISDLSYLNEVSDETVSGGWGDDYKFNKKIKVDVDIDIDSRVNAYGAQNELTFDLTAVGYYGSGTEVEVTQVAVDDYGYYVSQSSGVVLSYAR